MANSKYINSYNMMKKMVTYFFPFTEVEALFSNLLTRANHNFIKPKLAKKSLGIRSPWHMWCFTSKTLSDLNLNTRHPSLVYFYEYLHFFEPSSIMSLEEWCQRNFEKNLSDFKNHTRNIEKMKEFARLYTYHILSYKK